MPQEKKTDRVSVFVRLCLAADRAIDERAAKMGDVTRSLVVETAVERFVKNTPWVHLDIAGTALGSPHTDINRSWSSGWGVRLLDRLVADNYEG